MRKKNLYPDLEAELHSAKAELILQKKWETFAVEVEKELQNRHPDWAGLANLKNDLDNQQDEIQNAKILAILQSKDKKVLLRYLFVYLFVVYLFVLLLFYVFCGNFRF